MKTNLILPVLFALSFSMLQAQVPNNVGINTNAPHASSVLEVFSDTRGMLIPRMSTANRDAIPSPATGLVIFNTDVNQFNYFTDEVWVEIPKPYLGGSGINISGTVISATANELHDTDNDTKIQVEESPDEDKVRVDLGGTELLVLRKNANGDLMFDLPASSNGVFIGENAGNANTGNDNIFIGDNAGLANALGTSNTFVGAASGAQNMNSSGLTFIGHGAGNSETGNGCTYIGRGAGQASTNGQANVFVGEFAGSANGSGSSNTYVGQTAGQSAVNGIANTFVGAFAGDEQVTGANNTFLGTHSGSKNNGASENTFLGAFAGNLNVTGADNVYVGYNSGLNATGSLNCFVGAFAGQHSTNSGNSIFGNLAGSALNFSGGINCFFGDDAGRSNTTGHSNANFGEHTGFANTTGFRNTAIGQLAGDTRATNNSCTYLGYNADASITAISNSTALGQSTTITASHQVRVGNGSVTSIGGFQNFTNISDGRFKINVAENVPGLSFIKRLRPVTYNLDIQAVNEFLGQTEDDSDTKLAEQQIRTGFIAQEVEAAAKAESFDFSGVDKPEDEATTSYGLRYAEFTVPLVKAVQEQQEQIEKLTLLLEKQQAAILKLEKMLAAEAASSKN